MTVSFNDLKAMLAAKPFTPGTVPETTMTVLRDLPRSGVTLAPVWDIWLRDLARLQAGWPVYKHPRVALYAANYGGDLEPLVVRLRSLAAQSDPLTRLCATVNADLRVYELDLAARVPDTGLTEEEAAHAMSYGLMTVEEHVDCLVVDCLSIGVDNVLADWHAALQADDDHDAMALLLRCGGGHDLFALLGGVIAAYMAGVPVLCGARLGGILSLAMRRLLPWVDAFVFTVPPLLEAPDAVQGIAALQYLQTVLAFGPVTPKTSHLVSLPKKSA